MSRRRKQKVRELKSRFDKNRGEKKKKKMNANARRCPHCSHEMRPRGCSDVNGSLSWKCKNKKCGRTVWKREKPEPPEPVVPVSFAVRR